MNSPQLIVPLSQRLAGVADIECVTPDLNGIPRGKVMTVEGFLAGRRLQLARGVLLQAVMGGYPEPEFYGHDDGDLVLQALPEQVHVLPWAEVPRALAVCEAVELDGRPLTEARPPERRAAPEAPPRGRAAPDVAPPLAADPPVG